MKIRSSFVSNSSTSSFVLLGVELTEAEEERLTGEHDHISEMTEDAGLGYVGAEYRERPLIGRMLTEGDDYGQLKTAEISLEELDKMAKVLKEQYGLSGKVKLYMGTDAA